MKHVKNYFSICMKKAGKSCVTILIVTIFLAAGLGGAAKMLIDADANDISFQKVKIGLVGDLSESYLGIGIAALENIDESRFSIEFIEMDEESARENLTAGNINAYVLIPDDFVSDIVRGRDVQAEFVMLRTTATASSLLMGEVVKTISALVTESESGIYALIDYAEDTGAENRDENVKDLNFRYIDAVLSRSDAVKTEQVGVETLTMAEYYICGIITFFLLLFAVSCGVLFADKNIALGKLLRSKGMGTHSIILCEYAAYLIVVWIAAAITALAGGAAAGIINGGGIDIGWCAGLAAHLMPCVLMTAAMQFFVYEATNGIIAGVLAQFMCAAGMGYISGCFYPYYFFPQSVQRFAAALPSGITFASLREYFAGGDEGQSLVCLLYTALFLALSMAVRERRLRKEDV